MDEVGSIMANLKSNSVVKATRFTNNFLADVGEVLERDGFGAARVFLTGKLERSGDTRQARALLDAVLPELEASAVVRQRRSIGRYIVKILGNLSSQDRR